MCVVPTVGVERVDFTKPKMAGSSDKEWKDEEYELEETESSENTTTQLCERLPEQADRAQGSAMRTRNDWQRWKSFDTAGDADAVLKPLLRGLKIRTSYKDAKSAVKVHQIPGRYFFFVCPYYVTMLSVGQRCMNVQDVLILRV